MIKHFLNFINDGYGRHEVPEPINFSGTDFTLKQDDGRLGRDVSFSGGESSFIFTKFVHSEYFDKIQEYYEVYGNESEILYETEINNIVEVHGKFDFQTAKNNVYDKIEVSIIQEQTSELIKKRDDISINLFGTKTLDDVDITPCQTSNILLLSKPLLQYSELDMGNSDILVQTEKAKQIAGDASEFSFVMPILQPKKSGIKDTLLGAIQAVPTNQGLDSLKILNAKDNLKDFNLSFEWEFDLKSVTSSPTVNGYTKFQVRLSYNNQTTVLQTGQVNDDITSSFNGTFNLNIPLLNRFSDLYIYIYVETRKSSFGGTWLRSDFTFKKWNVKLEAVSKGVNTLVKGIRLHEAINYTSQSLAGIPSDFNYGETTLQDHFIFNGNLLRNLLDKPFYLKWQDVHNWMKLINADFELTPSNECFIGLEADYYNNTEMFVFDEIQNEEYTKNFNKKFLINKFQMEFENYQAKNENTDTNTNDTIHGQATFYTASKGVENKKEIKIPISYDPFLAEQKKREQVTKDDTTATKDDDSLFIFDCVPYVNQSFNETFLVKHTQDISGLKVTNDGSFSWLSLGLKQLDRVDIIGGHNLGDNYLVDYFSSTDRTLVLVPALGVTISSINEALTTFVYYPTDFDYQIRTTEGIDTLSGFDNPLDFGNVLWGAGRVTKQFYNSYLATANLYNNGKAIKNSSYTKNGNALINANGLAIKESEAFIPTNPILNQFIHTITVNCSFANFLILKNKVKTERGYIRVFDADGFPIKLYPKELTFLNNSDNLKNSKLTIVGEEKYQTNTINIVYANNGFLVINDEVIIHKLKYDEKRNKIYIFDNNRRLLFRPVFWQKVAVNGANATTIDELKSWLKQLE